ncbi:MAG TPA: lysylphosphatidylglycerol synthase transmembrane domain-containing protein [Methanomassiliicoccales archaeon]|nr:lysylphosphatidylglycerol synthase transmembrane domain-containing protein [Methanomassiliicoccales archaeon]
MRNSCDQGRGWTTGKMGIGTKLRLGISIGLIVLVILASNPEEVWTALTGINVNLILLVVVLYLINLFVKAYRWSVLMGCAGNSVPFRTTFTAFSLCQAINNLIPGKVLGETSRIVEMSAREGVAIGKGLASVVTERIMDFAVLTILAVTSLFLLLASIVEEQRSYLILLVALMVVANVLLIYVLIRPKLLMRIGAWGARLTSKAIKGEKGERYAAKVLGTVRSFNEAVAFSDKRLLVWPSMLTLLIWGNEIARLYLIIEALGVDVTLVAVIASASLASLSAVVLTAGSGNVLMSSAVLSASGLDPHVAATAGLLSAITSIWLSVPVSLLAMVVDHRVQQAQSEDLKDADKNQRGYN